MASLEEQETTVNGQPGQDWMIWTNVRRDITKFRKKLLCNGNGPVEIINSGFDNDGTEWIDVRIPRDEYSPVTGVKRKSGTMTEERKIEMRKRLAKARNAK